MDRVIWQYWETRGHKPAYIDGLHAIARKNAGIDVIQVTPSTLNDYLPDMSPEILEIEVLAHKADMIRTRLVEKYGGMWLDSDALVLRDLNYLFDYLSDYEFVGFTSGGVCNEKKSRIRINCFVSKPKGTVISEWVRRQEEKLPATKFKWEEIGTDLLNPICLENKSSIKILDYRDISPIRPGHVEDFSSVWKSARRIVRRCPIVMMSNATIKRKNRGLTELSIEELADGNFLLSDMINAAIDASYRPPSVIEKAIRKLLGGGEK